MSDTRALNRLFVENIRRAIAKIEAGDLHHAYTDLAGASACIPHQLVRARFSKEIVFPRAPGDKYFKVTHYPALVPAMKRWAVEIGEGLLY